MDSCEHDRTAVARRSFLQAAGLGGVALLVPTACGVSKGGAGADYPAKPITFIIPFSPGGSTDPLGRRYVRGLRARLDAKVNPVNRAGGGGTVGMGTVVKAKADGYTIGLSDDAGLALQPHINQGLPWKSEGDYFPIGKLTDVPGSLAVRSDADWESLDDFIAYARRHPGELKIGSSGELDITDIEAQEFGRVANIKIRTVPSSGGVSLAV